MPKRIEWPFQQNRLRRRRASRYNFWHVFIVAIAAAFACGAAWWHIQRVNQQLEVALKRPKEKETIIIREPQHYLAEIDLDPDIFRPPTKYDSDDRIEHVDTTPAESPPSDVIVPENEKAIQPPETAPAEAKASKANQQSAVPTSKSKPPQRPPTGKPVGPVNRPDFDRTKGEIRASIVHRSVRTKAGVQIGTGFSVGDGTVIVTNDHVLGGDDELATVTVTTSDGRLLKAIPKKRSAETDLAALSVFDGQVPPLLLARDDQFMWRTPVLVMGYGLGRKDLVNTGSLDEMLEWKALNRRGSGISSDTLLLKFNAEAHHGHSGSPVVTPDGLVVGVQSMIDPTKATDNFAIHVYHVRQLLHEAAPGMDLPKRRLSPTENARMDFTRTQEALKKLNEYWEKQRKRQPYAKTAPQVRSPGVDMFYYNGAKLQEQLRRNGR